MVERKYILFYDSGVGGVSVLRRARSLMPHENYLYFGDTANMPYGEKSAEEVKSITCRNLADLSRYGLKAIVIACNTATSSAIEEVRSEYTDIPVVGVEPAIKPAAEAFPGGRIAVLATPVTLREKKFDAQAKHFCQTCDIIRMPCAGLMEYVEKGIFEGKELDDYLDEKFASIGHIDALVLGCTHYPFVRKAIEKASHCHAVFDGADGAARHLADLLEAKRDIISDGEGSVTFINSQMSADTDRLAAALLEKE